VDEKPVGFQHTNISAVASVLAGFGFAPGKMGEVLVVEPAEVISLASRKGLVVVARPIGPSEGLVVVGETRLRNGLFEARVAEPGSGKQISLGHTMALEGKNASKQKETKQSLGKKEEHTNRRRQLCHCDGRRSKQSKGCLVLRALSDR